MSKSKVKIVSGWSNPGGSTSAHISLTNLLNESGYDCTFYGPHDWHLDKCQSSKISDFTYKMNEDIVISHVVSYNSPVLARTHIFSSHEKEVWPINSKQTEGKQNLENYDILHFVSDSQKEWQNVDYPNQIVIPPIVEKINWTPPKERVAGVIASVDWNKQVHISVSRAINEFGYKKVLIFGLVTDLNYFNKFITPYVNNGQVVMMGHESNKETMYGQISEIFHSSLSETYGLVEAECRLAGIPFNGESNGQQVLEKQEILDKWKTVLQ